MVNFLKGFVFEYTFSFCFYKVFDVFCCLIIIKNKKNEIRKDLQIRSVLIWIKWFAIHTPKFRSESNELWIHSEVPSWIMIRDPSIQTKSCSADRESFLLSNEPALKFRSKSNDSRYTIWSPDLNNDSGTIRSCGTDHKSFISPNDLWTRSEVPI